MSARLAQHQDRQPGHEHALEPQPDYAPRYPCSGRLEGEVAEFGSGQLLGRAGKTE